MYLTIKKEEIIDGLQKAASVIPTKAGAAYLRSIWMDASSTAEGGRLTFMASNVNIEFTGTYPANVREGGKVGVNGKSFVELLRRLPGGEITLRLEEDANVLSVEQGRRVYKLPVADIAWFQPLPPFPEEGAVLWSGDFFQDLIDRVFYCISDEESSESLSCICLKNIGDGKVDVCGLNGHRFALVRFINDALAGILPENGLLIQKKYVGELRKWLGNDEIMINVSERRFHIRTGSGNECMSIPRSANYIYPDHLSFMSRLATPGASNLDLDKREAMTALDRLLIFGSDKDRYTSLSFSPSEVALSAQGQEVGSANEHIECSFSGDIESIVFPTHDLIDILGHFQSEKVHFTLTGVDGPCGITGPEDTEYTVILMPMKIAESSYYEEEE